MVVTGMSESLSLLVSRGTKDASSSQIITTRITKTKKQYNTHKKEEQCGTALT